MIEETRLRQLLEAAAAAHPVPEGGPAAVLEAASEGAPAADVVVDLAERRARRHRLLAAAAAFVLLAGVGALLVRQASRPQRGLSAAVSSSAGADTPAGKARALAPTSSTAGPASALQPGAAPSAESRAPGPLIDLEVDPDTFAALDARLSDIAQARGGVLLASVTSGSRFQAQIQVPSQALAAALDDLRRLGRVVQERPGPVPAQAATVIIEVTANSTR